MDHKYHNGINGWYVDDVRFKANPYSERDYIEVVLEEKQ